MTLLPRAAARPDLPSAPRVVSPDELVTPPALAPLPRRPRELVAVLEPVWSADGDATASVHAAHDTVAQAAERLTRHLRPGELVAPTPDGRIRLLLQHEDDAARPVRLQEMAYHAVEAFESLPDAPWSAGAVIDLGVGWAPVSRRQDPPAAEAHAAEAAAESLGQRDLQPRQRGRYLRERRPRISHWTASHQVALATVGSIVLPFLAMVGLHAVGIDVSSVLYWVLVAGFSLTAAGIWAECARALDPPPLPAEPSTPAPPATAVIPAYLPNEADTIVETVHSFLAQDYAPGLQVVLAYNTPIELPVQRELEQLARLHPALTVLEVADSTSKAQNVNAALRVATGEFVGIFDADHHPMPGAFHRAWRWLGADDGPADVVQGHCVIRNGGDSWLAKLVAVEFEQIYAVSHPGRSQLHGFGIFGGSNGYWRASALERIRLRGSFLTEDIEASMRVLAAGGKIVNDPGLVSEELAPETVPALWKQRMRWSQGWFQVSLRHLWPLLRSPELSRRQRIGVAHLMGWRELYPWLTVLTWPLLGFLVWRDGGLDLTSPLFALVTLMVTVSGPLQAVAAWRLAAPAIRRRPWWFVYAAVVQLLVYTEAKNLVNRIAHIKQLRGEHQWVVTPRTAPSTASSTEAPGPTTLEEAA